MKLNLKRVLAQILPSALSLLIFLGLYLHQQSVTLNKITLAQLGIKGLFHFTVFAAYVGATWLILSIIEWWIWNKICVKNLKIKVPRILIDIVNILLGFVVLVWFVSIFYHESAHALLAASGIIGIAISLGVESVLIDLFDGIFLTLDNTYQLGDYIELILDTNDALHGVVIEITWRYTKLKKHEKIITIPNSSIAKFGIKNLSRMVLTTRRFHIDLSPTIPTKTALKILMVSAKCASFVVPQPTPEVAITAIQAGKISYMITYQVNEKYINVKEQNNILLKHIEHQLRISHSHFLKHEMIVHQAIMNNDNAEQI